MDLLPFDAGILIAFFAAYMLFVTPIIILIIVAGWRMFTKAGQPGWAVLIPFYNLYVYTQVLRRPNWWVVLYFIGMVPFGGPWAVLFVSIIDALRLAKVFGKPPVFGVGILLLGFIFIPVLAFGDAEYDAFQVQEGELV